MYYTKSLIPPVSVALKRNQAKNCRNSLNPFIEELC